MEHIFKAQAALRDTEMCSKIEVHMEINATPDDYTWTVTQLWDLDSNVRRVQSEFDPDSFVDLAKACSRQAELNAPHALDLSRDKWNRLLEEPSDE